MRTKRLSAILSFLIMSLSAVRAQQYDATSEQVSYNFFESDLFIVIVAVCIGLIIGITGAVLSLRVARRRCVKNPEKYMRGKLPPEAPSEYAYTTRGGMKSLLIFSGMFFIIPIIGFVFQGGKHSSDYVYIVAVFAMLVMAFVMWRKRSLRVHFDENGLSIEHCAVAYRNGGKQKNESVTLVWSEIASVDFHSRRPTLTTTDGRVFGIQTYYLRYGEFRWVESFHWIEIWLRIDYYRKMYGAKED